MIVESRYSGKKIIKGKQYTVAHMEFSRVSYRDVEVWKVLLVMDGSLLEVHCLDIADFNKMFWVVG